MKDPRPTQSYTLSLHDALPIYQTDTKEEGASPRARGNRRDGRGDAILFGCIPARAGKPDKGRFRSRDGRVHPRARGEDRKSTRLNSSHTVISYAVFCLKKKKKK